MNQRAFLALASVIGSEGWQGQELEQIEQIKVPLLVLSLANLSNESFQVSQAAQLFSQVLAKYLSPIGENIESVSSDLYPAMLASRLSHFTYPIIAEIFTRLQPRNGMEDSVHRSEIDPVEQTQGKFTLKTIIKSLSILVFKIDDSSHNRGNHRDLQVIGPLGNLIHVSYISVVV